MIVEVPRGGEGVEEHVFDVCGNIPPSDARRQNLPRVQYLRRLPSYFNCAR